MISNRHILALVDLRVHREIAIYQVVSLRNIIMILEKRSETKKQGSGGLGVGVPENQW